METKCIKDRRLVTDDSKAEHGESAAHAANVFANPGTVFCIIHHAGFKSPRLAPACGLTPCFAGADRRVYSGEGHGVNSSTSSEALP